MRYHTVLLALVCTLAQPAFAADFPGPQKVAFRTLDCDGATGMAQVSADAVSRVQPYTCSNGRQLKQVLTRSAGGVNEVFTISKDEAPKLEAELMRVQRARDKALEQTKPIVIQNR
jgi:hypothetical protein